MTSRFPLLLAAALFVVGLAGLLGTMASRARTSPFTPVRGPSAEASVSRTIFNQQPVLPTITLGELASRQPSATPAVPPATAPPPASEAAAAPQPEAPAPSPTPEPRPPLVIAAVASDEPHMLTPTPAPAPIRLGSISRDDPEAEGTPDATPSPTAEPATDTATGE